MSKGKKKRVKKPAHIHHKDKPLSVPEPLENAPVFPKTGRWRRFQNWFFRLGGA